MEALVGTYNKNAENPATTVVMWNEKYQDSRPSSKESKT